MALIALAALKPVSSKTPTNTPIAGRIPNQPNKGLTSCVAMKRLEYNHNGIPSGWCGVRLSILFSQISDQKRPPDQPQELNHACQDSYRCPNDQEPRCVRLEYLVHQHWHRGK